MSCSRDPQVNRAHLVLKENVVLQEAMEGQGQLAVWDHLDLRYRNLG